VARSCGCCGPEGQNGRIVRRAFTPQFQLIFSLEAVLVALPLARSVLVVMTVMQREPSWAVI